MPKSELQKHAESLLRQFDNARHPVVIEFAGVPKAGKTSTIGQVSTFLRRCGFRVRVVVERASVCPIRDKKHFTFNVWTAATTLAQILESTQDPPRADDPQILILDRGLFDSITWLTMMERLCRITSAEREVIERFLLCAEWRKRITGVIVMTASPETAMKRESGYLPVETLGSIMNKDVLAQFLKTTADCCAKFEQQFNIHSVDTTDGSPQKTAEHVAQIALDLIARELDERILFLPKQRAIEAFGSKTCLSAADGLKLRNEFEKQGKFDRRAAVEKDLESVQAIPVVIVRNHSGHILRLKRKERDRQNALHEQFVIWAGGHVRLEDSEAGRPIEDCAIRELKEELRLSIEGQQLTFLGAVYVDVKNSGKHVALVFEWRAKTDDVAITLSTSEFFERRGTSLSGQFVSTEELAAEISGGKDKDMEPWSRDIFLKLIAGNLSDPALF